MKKIVVFAVLALYALNAFSEIEVNTDYPGGNAVVKKINGNEIFLEQDLRDTSGWWFYWGFEVRGAGGKEIKVHFLNKDVIEAHGPAYSLDGGWTWQWLGADSAKRQKDFKSVSFTHKLPEGADSVRYCLAFPYQMADFSKFIAPYANGKRKNFKLHNLAKTERGRQNIYATFGNPNGAYKAVFTARHHACECMASYVMEGIVGEIMSDSETGKWLGENVEFLIVPFVDLDGVEDGDQGKNRKPHDHNRDYAGVPIYSSVKAIKKILPEWGGKKLKVMIDLHCPWIGNRGGDADLQRRVFFVYSQETKEQKSNLEKLSKIFESITTETPGAIAHFAREDIPYGYSWNTLKTRSSFKSWGLTLDGVEICTTLEISYSDVGGSQITDSSARNIGRNFARALKEYLEKTALDTGRK